MAEEKEANVAERRNGGDQQIDRSLVPATSTGQALAAASMAEVRLAMEMAIAYPRNEDQARSRIVKACSRYTFAEKAMYRFPRGKSTVEGPSIKLALEMGKAWGNLRWGATIIDDTEKTRTVRGWAWDLETNTKLELDNTFAKLIYRRDKGWIEPDERDLLELSNRQAAKVVRNCIINLLPWDMVDDAKAEVRKTMEAKIREDPEKFRKGLVASFAKMGISGSELTELVGAPLDQVTDVERMTWLRGIFNRLRDGQDTWQEVVAERAAELGVEGTPPSTARDLRSRLKEKAAEATAQQKAREEKKGQQP